MPQACPSLFNTYTCALRLYAHTFLKVLPFLLLLVLCHVGMDYLLPPTPVMSNRFFSGILTNMILTTLFFTVMVKIIDEHTTKPFEYVPLLVRAMHRFVYVLCAYIIVSLPLILTFLFIKIMTTIETPFFLAHEQAIALAQMITILIVVLFTLILCTYFFLAGIFIVLNGENTVSGLKKSGQLVKKYWVDTFLVVLLFGIINGFFSLLFDNAPVLYIELPTLFLGSFYPCLMIVHYQALMEGTKD